MDLKMHINSLLYKWLWRWNDDRESIYKSVIDFKHDREPFWERNL